MRKARYVEIDTLIRSHNSKEGVTFTMGHNRFSDWTTEERRTKKVAPLTDQEAKPTVLGSSSSDSNGGSTKTFSESNLPASVDWRDGGNVVTAVHD